MAHRALPRDDVNEPRALDIRVYIELCGTAVSAV